MFGVAVLGAVGSGVIVFGVGGCGVIISLLVLLCLVLVILC